MLTDVSIGSKTDVSGRQGHVRSVPILLQKSAISAIGCWIDLFEL
jgi:hypothetical protein